MSKKPHEETWAAEVYMHDHNQDRVWSIGVVPCEPHQHFAEVFDGNDARAQLAAAAPEMARVLLEMCGAELLPPPLEARLVAALKKAGVL